MRVVMLDPNSHTLPYDRALTSALMAAGCRVELAVSPFLYEPAATRDPSLQPRFFTIAAGEPGRRLGLDRRPRLRRVVKAAEYPAGWLALMARMLLRPPDVLHVQWSLQAELERPFWAMLQRRGVRIVYTVHNLWPHAAMPSALARLRRLYAAPDALIVHTERGAQELVTGFGVPAARVHVAPHGPLLEEEAPRSRTEARRLLGLPTDAPLLLFTGLIEPYKGLPDLVTAFIALADDLPSTRLVIAGRPNMPLTAVRDRLATAGLLARTHFDLRFLPQPELAAYLCAADIVVLPYRATTASGLLFAARRFGCPVVASAVGDLGVVIQHDVTGLLVPPADPPALAAALRRLLADPSLGARLGEAGRRVTLEQDTWAVAAARTIAAYRPTAPGG